MTTNVDWYAGDCDDELDDIAYTAGSPTDDPELLEQFDGNLGDADASASQVYASASRSFQEARELMARVKSARGDFLVVGIGAFDGIVSTGWSSTTTTIVFRVTCSNVPFFVQFFQRDTLALEMLPSSSEQGQHPVASQALSTRHWDLHSRAQKKRTLPFESSMFHIHDEKSEHEHGHTSTSEDDLLKLLNLLECTQNWTRFDKRAKTYRTTSSSGPLWENVVARITIDDKTGPLTRPHNGHHRFKQ